MLKEKITGMLRKCLTALIMIALIAGAGAVLIAITGAKPLDAFRLMFRAAFGSRNGLGE